LDDRATKLTKGTVQTMGSHMKCEVCGDVGHSGNNCPETQEEASYINNGFRQHQQPSNNGWNNHNHPQGNSSNFNSNYDFNQLSLKSFVLEQTKFNAYLAKKLSFNDRMFESINAKLETLSSSFKHQLSFNKMIENSLLKLLLLFLSTIREISWGNPRILPSLFMQLQSNEEEEVLPTDYKR
jgi:hypothetical protein